MLRDGAAPLPLPRAAGKGSSANAGDDTTGPAARPGGCRGAQRHAAPRPPPPERAEGPRVPSLSRCGLRRRSVPPLLPAAAASLPFNYQLKPQHRAAPRPPPPPPNPFQRREGEAAGLLSPGAGAPPGPARPPGRRAAPAPAAAPHAAPAAAVCAPRSLRSAGSAAGGRYPSAGVVTPGSARVSPLGGGRGAREGGGAGGGAGLCRRRGRRPCPATALLPARLL